ncbi:MAG: hypothetical protein AABZ29_01760 [Gemmatimonadota bacterium]
MKRVAVLMLSLTAACASLGGAGSSSGAPSSGAAIAQFLASANRKDLAAMAAVWGTERGPASKSMGRQELERRELIMMQCLAHEKSSLGASSPGEGGRVKVLVTLTAAPRSASPVFTTVLGPRSRWYVENLDIDELRNQGFCGATVTPP